MILLLTWIWSESKFSNYAESCFLNFSFFSYFSVVSFIQMPQYIFFSSLTVPVCDAHITCCTSQSNSEGKEVHLLSWERLRMVLFWAWPSWRYFWTPCCLLSLGSQDGAARSIFLRSRAWKPLVGWLHSLRWKGDQSSCPHWLFQSRAEDTHMLRYSHLQATAQAKLSHFSALP